MSSANSSAVVLPSVAGNTGPKMDTGLATVSGQQVHRQRVEVAEPVAIGVVASDGVFLPIESLAVAIAYASGNVSTLTVVYNTVTYVQTFTYASGSLTGASAWVAQ